MHTGNTFLTERTTTFARTLLALALTALVWMGSSASAIDFQITLDTGAAVPAPELNGGAPSGAATVSVDTTTGEVSVTGTYAGMTSNTAAAHLHGPALPGETAGVIVPLTVSGGTEGDITGDGTLTEAQLTDLIAGRVYLNVHTANNGPGEIRGQVSDGNIRQFDLLLDPDQEIPAPSLGDATPSGAATVLVDATSGAIEVWGNYAGMTSDVAAAHVHGLAPANQTAGVLFPLSVSGGTSGTLSGKGSLADENLAALFAGHTYINVHTANNGPGEIRGQITDRFIREFDVTLDTTQEIPPPNIDGASPSGQASVIVDALTGKLLVMGSYEGMSSDVGAAHIHGAARPGENAGVLVPLTVSGGTAGTITGNGSVFDAAMQALLAGHTYINVHTANNGPGEIRGQITDRFIREFDVTLDTTQEIPAPNIDGASPSGQASVIVDALTGKLLVMGSYEGMSSDVGAAHIHGAARPGENAGVLVPLTVSGGTAGTITGNGSVFDAAMQALLAGHTYINVHTANNGPGEIRGQITDRFIREFDVTLDTTQEIPAPNIDGASPSGQASVIVDALTGKLLVMGSYEGMSSDVGAAHIHGAARPGENAGVLVPLTVSGGTAGTITGNGSVFDAAMQALLAGHTYINVHTANNGPGEIRGQITDRFIREFDVTLDTTQEIPAPNIDGASPSGQASVIVDALTGKLLVMGSYEGMSSDVGAAHIHGAARPGENAGVLVPLTVSGGTAGTITGNGSVFDAAMQALLAGHTYINVHTANNGPGEIRGQITDRFIREFDVTLDTTQEIPAPNIDGASPSGQASVIVDALTGKLLVMGSYEGMSSDVGAAHIHGAARPGENAGVLVPLTVSGGTAGTITGNGSVFDAAMQALLAGHTYINVHTANNGPGEIRGQITDRFIREFDVTLDTTQEIPAPNIDGASPSGQASVIVDALTGKLLVMGSYEGMSSDVGAAHIHGAARPGENAGVLVPLTVSGGTAGTITGNGSVFDAAMQALLAGHTYINVHTANNGPGEIRGQITDRFVAEIEIVLEPAQELPAPELGGANPMGTAVLIVDRITGTVFIEGAYNGMTSNVVAAHLHGLANVGSNAGVLIPLTASGGTAGSITGFGSLSLSNLNGLLNGQTYLNVHTENNGPGEIRGQVPGVDLEPPVEGELLPLDISIDRETGRAEIFVDTLVGSLYDLEASRDLIVFFIVFEGIPGTGKRIKFQDPDFPEDRKYFRVRQR